MAYLPSVILVLLAVTSIWVSSRMFGHPISPFSVFYGVWFITLALFFLRLVEYTPVRAQAWRLVVLNLASFGFGWMLAYLFQGSGVSRWRSQLAVENISPERLRKIIFLFFLLGMIGLADFLWQVQRTIGLATFWESPHEIRWEMRLGGVLAELFQLFTWLNVANVVLGVFYLAVLKGDRRRYILTIVAASAFATLLVTDRSRFFCAALWTGFLLAHARNWKARRILTVGLVVALILMVQFFAVGAWIGKVAENNPELLATATVSEPYFAFLEPYIYLTGSFPALQAYIDSAPESTAGSMTFYPSFKVKRMVDPSVKLPIYVPEPFSVPLEFNTFTWLHPFYSDFGFAGVVLGPWTIGVIAGLVYFQMRRSCSFNGLYINRLICYGLALSFIGNQLTQGPVWYFLALGIPISRYITRPVPALAQG